MASAARGPNGENADFGCSLPAGSCTSGEYFKELRTTFDGPLEPGPQGGFIARDGAPNTYVVPLAIFTDKAIADKGGKVTKYPVTARALCLHPDVANSEAGQILLG
jgi:hypothetical protein